MADLNENIIFSIVDNKINNDDVNVSDELNKLLNTLEEIDTKNNSCINEKNEYIAKFVDYNLNYKIKDLYLICEYYNILKEVKMNKCNKNEIVNIIIEFENNINNFDIVNKRKNMWFYMSEIKNDKFLKKYILL